MTLAVAAFLSVMLGTVALKPADVLYAIFHGSSNDLTSLLVHNVRMPRTAGAVLTGMGLAVAGTILQSVMNNSLASPNTIGVNSGAGFAVMVGMLIFNGSNKYSPIFAFAGALITTLIIYALASIGDSSRTTIILAGITVSSFLSAGINTIKLLDTDITINITTFMIGTLSGITYKAITMPAIGIIGGVLVSFLFAKHMNVLSLGDDIARSLGLNVPLTRFVLLTAASLLAGCVVSYAGLLSFVGLIVPHIARRLFGNDARLLLPCSAILGAIFVTLCDLIGRMIAAPYELPAGIIMSFIGGPFFLYLLLKKKGGRRVNA
jgi:iron complex transport system permease protein